ncbi:MAG: TonB-dependent receptor, partial [Spirochaetes bacterium]|nr:TonB-dependent receptor [Spirochaetota bacterium]
YSFSASHLKSNGISKASESDNTGKAPDDDGYKNITVSSRLGVNILKDSMIDFNFRYIDIDAELDDTSVDDPNYNSYNKFFSAGVKFKQPVMKWWDHNINLSYFNQLRRYRDKEDEIDPTTYNQWFEGNNKKATWQHNFYMMKFNTLICGAEVEEEKASFLNYDDYGSGPAGSNLDEQKVRTLSYYIQNHLKLLDRIFIILGGRIDNHKEFGNNGSYKASGSFIMPVTDTRLTCNYGTGFKAPSIYQLYDINYGDKNLEPEESRSFDAGLEQKLFNDLISFEAAYFINTYKNMLNFGSARYENIGKASMKGVEGEISVQPLEYLKIRYVHTYQVTEDRTTGKVLYKRPKNQGSLIVNLFLFDQLNINLSAEYKSKRKDMSFDPITYESTDKTLDSFVKFDLSASYDLLENLQLFGRVENITDKDYQEAYGYAMPGRSFYGGARAAF